MAHLERHVGDAVVATNRQAVDTPPGDASLMTSAATVLLGLVVEADDPLEEFRVIGQVYVAGVGGVAEESEHAMQDVGFLLLKLPFLVSKTMSFRVEVFLRRGAEA
ncbi:hypothetical protein ACFU8W_24655 [Streptomyces sp. NPDC057565]|uniref:hypothetical protein n=1 Tax=Streptomyces sp. NPDC057565 TaxID=3346169 RepID=UPI003697EB9F